MFYLILASINLVSCFVLCGIKNGSLAVKCLLFYEAVLSGALLMSGLHMCGLY